MGTMDFDPQARFRSLVERHRAQCLWFLREDYLPTGAEEVSRVLAYLERYGDRETFVEARKLNQWLSHVSSGNSATS